MKRLALPEIEDKAGLLVKAEADNLYCLFDRTDDAVRAARAIVRQLNAANLILPEDRRLYASIGIGYGPVLNIDDSDLFGDEMNLTCKLGEDIAQRSEILLTEGAAATLALASRMMGRAAVSLSRRAPQGNCTVPHVPGATAPMKASLDELAGGPAIASARVG